MKYDRPVTPAELTSALRRLSIELSPDAQPVLVSVRPLPGAPPDECFPLVEAYSKRWGGSSVLGWTLWEFPSLFVEAEFHAVWQSPANELIDITAKRTVTERIFFLPDPARPYEGRQVNNVRRPLSADPRLLRYLQTFDEKFDILNRGKRMEQHGLIELSADEVERMRELELEGFQLFLELRASTPEIGPYSSCPCGSGRKVKWCHRQLANAA